MQSPIPIKQGNVATKQISNFSINYIFNCARVLIVRRFNEIVITFRNDPGLIMITIGKKKGIF